METTTDTRSRTFLRERVGRFGLLVGCLFGAFLTFRGLMMIVVGDYEMISHPSVVWHGAAAASFFAVWVLCRFGPESDRYVRGVEACGLLVGTGATGAMGMAIPLEAHPEMIILMALTLGFCARSIYVPSSASRTLGLGVAMAVPIAGATLLMYAYPDARAQEIEPKLRDFPLNTATELAVATTVWWALAVTVATAASNVIYGLRREVRDALQVGQYRLEEKLGEGGMGTVYRAHHALLRRPTAVKLLPAHKAGDAVARFEREVQMTARLCHPNTVTIFDYGRTAEGVFYYAMELIDGATLGELVEVAGPQPASRARILLRQAADALVEAHGIGLIHRDIKPANIMVFLPHHLDGMHEMVKVVDFGLVKNVGGIEAVGMTSTGLITGTPQYMAPESITQPDTVDARTDIYALGAVGYFLLTGEHLFEGKTVIEVCSKHLNETPEPPSKRRGAPIDRDLESLILECLAKDPNERPASAAEVRDRLDALTDLGTWGAVEAREWWAEYETALTKKRRNVVLSVEATMDVRFAHRETVIATESSILERAG